MYTDADIEMAQLTEAGNNAAAGLCVRCEQPLDPTAPKWAGQFDTHRVLRNGVVTTEPWTPQQEAEILGPVLDWGPYHVYCMEDDRPNIW